MGMDIRDSQRIKEIRDNTAKMADAFTRIADALERLADRKDEPTISKMEQVDKDINVRSKDEPQKIYCPKCGSSDYIKDLEKDFGVKDNTFKYKCINCNTYIKDEPQTDVYDYKGNGKWERSE